MIQIERECSKLCSRAVARNTGRISRSCLKCDQPALRRSLQSFGPLENYPGGGQQGQDRGATWPDSCAEQRKCVGLKLLRNGLLGDHSRSEEHTSELQSPC